MTYPEIDLNDLLYGSPSWNTKLGVEYFNE